MRSPFRNIRSHDRTRSLRAQPQGGVRHPPQRSARHRRDFLRHRQGRGAGRGRRIRRRQIRHGTGRHRADRSARPHQRRRDLSVGPADRQSAAGRNAPHPRQAHRHDLPGSADQPQSAVQDRRSTGRDHPHPPQSLGIAGAQARHRSAGRGRHPRPRQAHRRLSARILRRHAPARGDCAGDLRRTGTDHRRRADHRARRLGAGADHLADQAARARSRHRRDAGDPRHGRDRRDLRPGRGDVFRPHRRDRPGAGCGAAPAASLCQGA